MRAYGTYLFQICKFIMENIFFGVFFQGFELEDQDSDQERQLQLQKVAEEWDTILGRSHEDNNCDPSEQETNNIEWVTEANVESSNDSMRTMFSNSAVNLKMSNNNKSGNTGATANVEDTTTAVSDIVASGGRPSSALRRSQ